MLRRPARPLQFILPWALGLAAVGIRLVVFFSGIDAAGDGPTRAAQAYDWSHAPRIVFHQVWPPGFLYLTGAFAWLVPDPVVSVRIVSLILGSLTVPLFYLLVRRIFSGWPALFSASILALMPLHIGLSVTSLTEAPFLCFVVAAMLLFIDGTEGREPRHLRLAAGVLLFILALMTRYEAWVILPAFPLYYFAATKRLRPSVVLAVILSIFPVTWSVGNYLHRGSAVYGFAEAVKGSEAGPNRVSVVRALHQIAQVVVREVGWMVPVLALVGLVVQLARWRRHGFRSAGVFYTAVAATQVLAMVVFTMSRGSIWERNLLFGLVMCLPYAALPLENLTRLRAPAVAAAILLNAVLAPRLPFAPRIGPPYSYITGRQPREMERLATWLRNSRYRGSYILVTKMDWKSTYLFLYAPEFHRRSMLYSFWNSDASLRAFVARRNPALLITSERDLQYQRRLDQLLPKALEDSKLVYREDGIQAFEIGR